MMSESSKRHSKFLSLIFILKCLSKASVIRIDNLPKNLKNILELLAELYCIATRL